MTKQKGNLETTVGERIAQARERKIGEKAMTVASALGLLGKSVPVIGSTNCHVYEEDGLKISYSTQYVSGEWHSRGGDSIPWFERYSHNTYPRTICIETTSGGALFREDFEIDRGGETTTSAITTYKPGLWEKELDKVYGAIQRRNRRASLEASKARDKELATLARKNFGITPTKKTAKKKEDSGTVVLCTQSFREAGGDLERLELTRAGTIRGGNSENSIFDVGLICAKGEAEDNLRKAAASEGYTHVYSCKTRKVKRPNEGRGTFYIMEGVGYRAS
ncbi:MAG: hypothetical protein ABIG28_00870 [archaeon]